MVRFTHEASRQSLIAGVLDDFIRSVSDNGEEAYCASDEGYTHFYTTRFTGSEEAVQQHSAGKPIASVIQTALASLGYDISQIRVQYKLGRHSGFDKGLPRFLEFQLDTTLEREELKIALGKTRLSALMAG